jgi:phage gp46-like protein
LGDRARGDRDLDRDLGSRLLRLRGDRDLDRDLGSRLLRLRGDRDLDRDLPRGFSSHVRRAGS